MVGSGTREPQKSADRFTEYVIEVSTGRIRGDLVARHGEIDEMDLNPVIVHEKGLTVVDARVVLPT
jgi:hypothetical protein